MKPESIRQKGKRFENYIAQQIEEAGLGQARREIGSGSGKRKGDIFSSLEFLLECKNQAKLNWWHNIDQAKQQAIAGNFNRWKWTLITRDPRTPEDNPDIYATIDFWQFLKMIKDSSQPISKEPDQNLKWKLENLKNSINQVLKEIK